MKPCLILLLLLSLFTAELLHAASFGTEGGEGVKNGAAALSEAYGETLPDLEIIFSYAMFTERISGIEDINPFGHIAIAMNTEAGYRVITVNQKAVSGKENLFFALKPEDYFYRTEPMSGKIHGSHTGIAYARSSASIQLRGLDNAKLDQLATRIKEIDQDHQVGASSFCVKTNNCATLTADLLKQVGLSAVSTPERFPAAVFDKALRLAQKIEPELKIDVTFYRKVESDHEYKFENIPAPGYRFFVTLLNMLGYNSLGQLTGPATLVESGEDKSYLTVRKVQRASAVASTCARAWIFPFVRSIFR